MNNRSELDNASREVTARIPRMMSETDVALVRECAASLPKKATILEFGPWLGGVSVHLAPFGKLHVVDRFQWTDANAERYPGILEPGRSFRSIFERNMKDVKADYVVHETDMREFVWDGPEIDLCFLDIPRNPTDLLRCLIQIAPSLHQNSMVFVKNGLNPAHYEMMSLLEVLLGLSIFDLIPVELPSWCTIAFMRMGVKRAMLQDIKFDETFFDRHPVSPQLKDPWGGPKLSMARLAEFVSRDQFNLACDQLDRLPPDLAGLNTWDEQEPHLPVAQRLSDRMSVFRDAVAFHHSNLPDIVARIAFEKSASLARRAYWKSRVSESWREKIARTYLVDQAYEAGVLNRPQAYEALVQQGGVIEVGPETKLSGIGYIAAGASSYIGVEPHTDSGEAATLTTNGTAATPTWLLDLTEDHSINVVQYGDAFTQADLIVVHSYDEAASELARVLTDKLGAVGADAKLVHVDKADIPLPDDAATAEASGLTLDEV